MKKTVQTLLFLLFITKAFTQQQKIDSMLIGIDKTNFTTNILYERTTPWSKLHIFNDSINISTTAHFEQALHELYKASKEQKFIFYRDLRAFYTPKSQKNTVDIGIISANFNQINYVKDNETKSALRIVNNKFEKINNSKPIFIEKQVLVIAPLKEELEGNNITFKFSDTFIFEENNKQIQYLTANFDTQTDYTIINNGNIITNNVTVNYSQEGIKTLTFVAVYTDGTTQTTSAIVQTTQARGVNEDPLIEDYHQIADILFNGVAAEIEYRVFYRTKNDNQQASLVKPIIIIDGFDPRDKRRIGYLYDNPNDKTLINQMYYENIDNENTNIVTELRERGYDVVIVNQITHKKGGVWIDGGADYIERNAMAHVALYQELNSRLVASASTNKLVIMGPSMGGQISRYALAYMEKHNIEHNTRLWVSLDSPHLGANIPVGQQSLIKIFADIFDKVDAEESYYGKLKSAAGKEQLIEQHKGNDDLSYLNNGEPLRQQYINNLATNGLSGSNGYPLNLRKVAIVNGSLTSKNIGVAGEEDFRVHSFVKQVWWDIKVSEMNTRYMPNTGETVAVTHIWRQWKPTRTITYTNNNPNGSMDIVPGGLFDTENETHKQVMGSSPSLNLVNFSDEEKALLANLTSYLSATGNASVAGIGILLLSLDGDYFGSRVNKEVHSFVPTVSALGFKNPNFNWSDDINRNLVCTDEIPFDNYYGTENNTVHTSFSEESANWLFQELEAGTNGPFPNPSVFLKGEDLIGEDTICYNETNTYYFNDCKTPGAATWQLSQSLVEIASTDTSITVKSISPNAYQHWIKASFQNNTPAIKNIHGKPNVTYQVTNSVPNRPIITLTGIEPNYTVVWEQTGGNGTLYDAGFGDSVRAASGSQANWVVEGVVHITSRCGTSNMQFIIHGPDNPCGDLYLTKTGNNTYQAKTNPNEDPYNPCGDVNINNAELYSAYGIKEQDLTPQNNEINLNNAQSGTIKIIKVVVDNKVLTKRVIVD